MTSAGSKLACASGHAPTATRASASPSILNSIGRSGRIIAISAGAT